MKKVVTLFIRISSVFLIFFQIFTLLMSALAIFIDNNFALLPIVLIPIVIIFAGFIIISASFQYNKVGYNKAKNEYISPGKWAFTNSSKSIRIVNFVCMGYGFILLLVSNFLSLSSEITGCLIMELVIPISSAAGFATAASLKIHHQQF